jgi:hypothetical protein
VQVRDRRSGELELFTIDDPRHLTAAEGVPAGEVPPDVRRDLAAAGLLAGHDGHVWWLPAHVRRWPFPSLVI